ncbi:hypothetical protein HYFRA_00010482 [Hymenoscyphus fraxineus]|uniref:FAD dependent oxidoreductase domain-containing protein n=1 Tax=Hymenoscyphus fraxineus TaxID=746836 RepID=A0A9N9L4L8_9HELO|nr:hypothetical protein HYFRA_00010482 [Hymenoscyphus fraxineus]
MEDSTPIGIIGAGITGLACAYVLSSKYQVIIVARDLPGDLGSKWASPWAGAVFHPQATNSPVLRKMQSDSFAFYEKLAKENSTCGVQMYPMTEYVDTEGFDKDPWYKSLMPDYRVVPSSELPPGIVFGVEYTSLAINPLIFLPWLESTLLGRGVKFIRKEISSPEEAKAITGSRLLINASGVGAKHLANDTSVHPIRGQTMFVKSDVEKLFMLEGTEYTYIIPRPLSGGVIIGGVKSERLDTDVDVSLKANILARVNRISKGAFKNVDLENVQDIVGFRPGRREGLRVERVGSVVHAYGAGGAGYIYSFGVAVRVWRLVEGGEKDLKGKL